jgi:hypothetical protein
MPQLLLSVWRSRQTPEQLVVPATHETEHVPAEHTCPEAQVRPHAPQFKRSVWRSRHVPVQST